MNPSIDATPLVSIVMSAFNAERWLPASLDSAIAQTYPQCEIIVVNDGSSDGTGKILGHYAEKHGIRVVTQTNQGQSAALNRGLVEARGDYVKFFDSDDLLSPNFVEVQVAALAEHRDRLAYGTWGRFHDSPDEATFAPHPGWHDADSGADWLIETWADTEPMYQCALFLIPRSLLARAGGWDERLSLINDFEFFTRLVLKSEGLVFTPEARLFYRSNLPGSLSNGKSRKAIESGALSTTLGVAHLLAVNQSPLARRAAGGMLQSFVYSFYPRYHDLSRPLLLEARRLGGTSVRPDGGRVFRLLRDTLGWRIAMWVRYLFSKT